MGGELIEEYYLNDLLAYGEEPLLDRFLQQGEDRIYLHHAFLDMRVPEQRAAEIATFIGEDECYGQSLVTLLLIEDRVNREGRLAKALREAGVTGHPCPDEGLLLESDVALALDHYVSRERWSAMYRFNTYLDDELWNDAWRHAVFMKNLSSFVLRFYIDWWLLANEKPSNSIEWVYEHVTPTVPVNVPARPIRVPEKGDYSFLNDIVPLVALAMEVSAAEHINSRELITIATTRPSQVPFFNGLDLWLRRKALRLLGQHRIYNDM